LTQHIARLAYLVRECDEAIAYFTQMLAFALVEDTAMGGCKRWNLVEPHH